MVGEIGPRVGRMINAELQGLLAAVVGSPGRECRPAEP